LSEAIQQINPIEFTPNFDNADNFLQHIPLFPPSSIEQNRITANHLHSLGLAEDSENSDWHADTNHLNRVIAPTALSQERDLPSWIADSVSDRFNNPFLVGFPDSSNHRTTETQVENDDFNPFTSELDPAVTGLTDPSRSDHHRSISVEKVRVSTHSSENQPDETAILNPTYEDKHVSDIGLSLGGGNYVGSDDMDMILDTMFEKLGSKQPCALKLYPVYKIIMEDLIKEVLSGYVPSDEQGELFVMLWRDLKICRYIKMSKTNSFVKRLQRLDKKKLRSNFGRSSKAQSYRNLKKKKEYVQKALSKRYKFYKVSKRRSERGKGSIRKTPSYRRYTKRGKTSFRSYFKNGGSSSHSSSRSSQEYSNSEESSSEKNFRRSQDHSDSEGSSSQQISERYHNEYKRKRISSYEDSKSSPEYSKSVESNSRDQYDQSRSSQESTQQSTSESPSSESSDSSD
jgi:hypothetical protein